MNDTAQLIDVINQINHQKGKYIKNTLVSFEQEEALDPKIRKIILDSFNDYTRSIFQILGYSVEV